MITERTVVIVESQPMMRTALTTTLSSEGMIVLAALADSRDAQRVVSTLTPDLILFSVNGSSLKELELLSALQQGLPKAQIVALVTGEVHGQYQLALDYGAHLVLTKSTPRSEMLTAIKRMAGQRISPATVQVN